MNIVLERSDQLKAMPENLVKVYESTNNSATIDANSIFLNWLFQIAECIDFKITV